MPRYLGIDFGEKRVGLAMSDPTLTIAQPLRTIRYHSLKELINQLKTVVNEFSIEKIVCGLPLTMKGTDSRKTTEVREFVEKLQNRINIPVVLFDERMTTVQAQMTLQQLGKKPSRNREIIDQIAAQFILQTFLDHEKQRVKR
ncbi:MAG: Holliday junction resolvase RuvX [Calditrichaeota bacterium]|nr:Holliday junction resolvase RuvX [Calditrichota bacterium]RQW06158.1 MAG: Holliday junction resolvase RuvX [Calditrichota bacterium]